MKVSAVGFLFQNKIKGKGLLNGKNYICAIHKKDSTGTFRRDIYSSPLVEKSRKEIITQDVARKDILGSLNNITAEKSPYTFIGATIKDGNKETEVHSVLFNKLFAVRTKDEAGKNHFRILGKNGTHKVLADNLYVYA